MTPHNPPGVVGLGVPGSRSRIRTRPDLCAEHGHPGVTYNPHLDETCCLCGEIWRPGGYGDWTAQILARKQLTEHLRSDGTYGPEEGK